VPLLDEDSDADRRWLASFIAAFGGMDFVAPPAVTAARVLRGLAREPAAAPRLAGWAARFTARAGGPLALRRDGFRAITYVMHSFMDARHVKPAWELLQVGEVAEDPKVREAQERLQACSYAMAPSRRRRLVPACVQHSVLDPQENLALQQLLRRRGGGRRCRPRRPIAGGGSVSPGASAPSRRRLARGRRRSALSVEGRASCAAARLRLGRRLSAGGRIGRERPGWIGSRPADELGEVRRAVAVVSASASLMPSRSCPVRRVEGRRCGPRRRWRGCRHRCRRRRRACRCGRCRGCAGPSGPRTPSG
jgi:hypothetical protein